MRGLTAALLRRAVAALAAAAPSAAGASSSYSAAAASAAAPISARLLAAAAPPAARGFAASASTSGRTGLWASPGEVAGGLATATPIPPSPLASANPVAALKARLMPATGRNQFRRKWRKQAEIKVRRDRETAWAGRRGFQCVSVPCPFLSLFHQPPTLSIPLHQNLRPTTAAACTRSPWPGRARRASARPAGRLRQRGRRRRWRDRKSVV